MARCYFTNLQVEVDSVAGVLVPAEKNKAMTYTTSTTRTRTQLRGQEEDDSDLDM